MNTDYIIVGLGLAGIAFAEELGKRNKSFVVFEDSSQNSSLVAGGMYNPVILKRFTPVWNAEEQLAIALPFYENIEKRLGRKYDYKVPIYRVFKSVEEQNNWFAACDEILLQDYMVAKIIKNENKNIQAPFHLGKLVQTGRVDVHSLAKDYRQDLMQKDLLRSEQFEHNLIQFEENLVSYKDIQAKKIVFCEGFGLKENPFFNYLPLQEAKGELLTIHAPDLKLDGLVKAAVFVLPLGNDLYKVGATFNWVDKTKEPTLKGKEELIKKLETVINCSYTVVDHVAGIRPTTKDRRPFIGVHPQRKQLAILNGLGTRGVMIAPSSAQKLVNHLEDGIPLEKDISIERFSIPN
jgi:glycine/D-amino acid oxidase-like deaminating enzyme